MSRFFDLVSKPAREMGDYLPSVPQGHIGSSTQPRLISLDSNENPFGPSPRAMAAIEATVGAASSYPEDDCTTLRRQLARHHDVPLGQVLVTAGSTALIDLLCRTLLAPGLNAVTSERSFVAYSMAVHAAGAELLESRMQNNGFDLSAILAAINEHTRIVFLPNPNNPTGTLLDVAALDRFLCEVPGHVVVVIDEAYYEFAAHFSNQRKIEYAYSRNFLQRGASVVILRTFSKAHGLAGLRVGYGIGPAELLGYCSRMRSTFSVSSVAQAAAQAALDDEAHIIRTVHNNFEQAQFLTDGLTQLGFRVVPTWANFLYCDVGSDASSVAESLRENGVSVRPLGGWGAPRCLRISIGTPEQNQTLLNAAAAASESHRIAG